MNSSFTKYNLSEAIMIQPKNTQLTLISHKLCPYVQRAAITLEELNIDYKRIDIDLNNKPDWFKKLSPTGKVPLLVIDDDTVLFESAVIAEYINDSATNAENTLLSSNPLAKAKRVKKLLETYFKQEAEKLFVERLELLSTQTSLVPRKVIIRQYSARWGSCNNRGELSLNYLLIMAPIFVIDYVIIHELCHLEHLNHSKSFWGLVEQYCPNYHIAKKWLKTHQSQLHWKKLR